MELSGAHSPCRSLVCCFMQMYGRMLTKNRSFSLTGASVKACLISAYASNMKSLMSIFTDALPSSEGGNGKWRLKGVFIYCLKFKDGWYVSGAWVLQRSETIATKWEYGTGEVSVTGFALIDRASPVF